MRQVTASRVVVAAAVLWVFCLTYAGADQSQGVVESATAQTVWSGIYTDAQAFRGEKVADTSCIGCHGSKLDGGDSGPRLVGPGFLANWSSQPISELFGWIQEAMPSDAPGTLSKEDTAAVVAYILQLNKMPAGKQDLPTERDELARIAIVEDKQ